MRRIQGDELYYSHLHLRIIISKLKQRGPIHFHLLLLLLMAKVLSDTDPSWWQPRRDLCKINKRGAHIKQLISTVRRKIQFPQLQFSQFSHIPRKKRALFEKFLSSSVSLSSQVRGNCFHFFLTCLLRTKNLGRHNETAHNGGPFGVCGLKRAFLSTN